MYRLTPASPVVQDITEVWIDHRIDMNWPLRWYPVTQEEAEVDQFVAIPLNNGDLWNSLSTSWSTSWEICLVH